MEKKEFGSSLKNLRKQAGLSQRELAEKVGIDFTYLSKIENGVMSPPSQEVILRLAEVLDADRDELLTLAGKVPVDIAQILKNLDVLHALRAGSTAKQPAGDGKMDSFGKKLRELREAAGLSEAELAVKVGVSFTYLSKIENGVKPPPSEKVILKLAEALNCDKDVLMASAGKVPSDIARILKNRDVRQGLRENQAKRVMSASGKKRGVNIMKQLMNGRSLVRVALAFVLVLAMAASLWFSSPTEVQALKIAITNSSGNTTLDTGTLGQIYNFKLMITIEDGERLPINNINLSISANATGDRATLLGLPLINGGIANYTNGDTNGGVANVTANTSGFLVRKALSGNATIIWQSVPYTFPTAYGYGAVSGNLTITYNVLWTPPLSWPSGNYTVSANITNDTNTFTQVSSLFALQIQPAAVGIAVGLQGGARPNPAGWVVPLSVKFFPEGTTNFTSGWIYSFTQNTTKIGNMAVANFTGINPGTYIVGVKSANTLANLKSSVVVSQAMPLMNMGTLLEGNADESDPPNAGIINISDFTLLSTSYGLSVGDPGFNPQANFDRNSIINISDFTLLSVNFGKTSPNIVP